MTHRPPLTAAQQQLVAEHWRYALAIGRNHTTPQERRDGEWTGAVGLAVCHAAANYEHGRDILFRTFMARYVEGVILELRRRRLVKGYRPLKKKGRAGNRALPRVWSLNNPLPDGRRRDFLDRDRMTVGWELESQDAVEALTRGLPHGRGEALRRLYLRADTPTHAAVGRSMGLHQTRASQLCNDGMRCIRERVLSL